MPVCFAALMCHAPIVLPEVSGSDATQCARTTRAMREIAARAVASRPARLVLISPHTHRQRDHLTAWPSAVRGDLARFGAPHVRVDLPAAPDILARFQPATADDLDHGASVPLAFLVQAGWTGPTAVLALPWNEGPEAAAGRLLAELEGPTAVIASGDMSHRLRPGAPAGYHPLAAAFDAAFVDALRHERWTDAADPPHREHAAEDVIQSFRVAATAAGKPRNAEVLSYEGPWGVGYAQAILADPFPPSWATARRAVRARVLGLPMVPPQLGAPAGVFVTLTLGGVLRGCIGHVDPLYPTLHEDIAVVAPLSATEDPRFPPVTPDELDDLDIEVSILEPPQRCTRADLDPRTWGVVVTHGGRRGILLPDLEGVDTADQQVAIALLKAGIRASAPFDLHRFRVRKEAMP